MTFKFKRYESRFQAGEILADLIQEDDKALYDLIIEKPHEFFGFAIPNGGVPVAEGFCSKLKTNFDMLIVRKIKIPWNTEAGFGSVTTDGTVLINEPLLEHLALSEDELSEAIDQVISEFGATTAKDFGRVMKEVMNRNRGRVDGKQVQELVRAKLT